MSAIDTPTMRRTWNILHQPIRVAAQCLLDRAALNADQFKRALSVERKRSERSRKPLVFVLIDGNGLFAANGGSARSRVIAHLLEATRDTDVVGWHVQDRVLGALFTETGEQGSKPGILRQRVVSMLQKVLPNEDADRCAVSVHVFPSPSESGQSPNLIFYPEAQERHRQESAILKRSIDLIGSAIALLLSWPIWLLLALLIKATSRGPVFFRQTRIGRYGKPFTFLKFRSMYVNCDSSIHEEYIARLIAGDEGITKSDGNGHSVYKITDDPRVTPLGRVLRRTSLDELPQFLNVLLGDMSLVGPRPPLPYEVYRYEPWHHRRVVTVKPGITGLWQVNGRSRTSFDEMVRLDLQYVENASIALDLKILLETPRAVLLGTGY